MSEEKRATLKEIKEYFGISTQEMMANWKELSAMDREFFMVEVARAIEDKAA